MVLCYENELWMSYIMKWKRAIWPWNIFDEGHNNDEVQLNICKVTHIWKETGHDNMLLWAENEL